MIAIDLDGTLLSPAGHVTPRARQAVHKCLQAGLLVCFATGRNWTESRTVLEAIDHYDTAVFVGGAMVVDTKRRVTLHRTLMDAPLAAEVCRVCEHSGHAALAMQDDLITGIDYLITSDIPVNRETRRWLDLTHAKVRWIPRLGDHAHEHTIRVGVVGELGQVAQTQRLLEEKFGERLFAQTLTVEHSGIEVLEVFDPSVNKWEGIMQVARRHHIRPEQIVAIGDDLNDLHMIRNSGLGVAMGNAKPEVRQAAKLVVGDNGEEGLAKFLEDLVEMHAVRPAAEEDAA
ncbi:MAG: Cof-type HAD-IIB family hydrolase [Tepidisphaeraceae bacterium]